MGEVFLAERDDGQFEQRVALKVIQHGAPGLVRRFLDERRILALLEHPGIARLVDGGVTGDGLPYFAMELVEGEPIDRYCDTHKLSIERRLELFSAVCDAVTYAHQHLVIHRDLKPSNILVTTDGQVKLLDFGIAKLLTPESPDDKTRTQFQVMTPEFAAPEQVREDVVSTATDVYSLGVLLYMLLIGERPYDVRGKSPADVERIVCDHEPPKPSSKAPERLRRRLRGDLDLIVLTALHKEKERRYQSTAELKQELTRFLAGRPVAARPDSAGYRARKFIGRHRPGLIAVAAIALLLITYVVTVLRDRQHIQRALAEAQAGTHKAEQVTDFMLGLFEAAAGGKALTDTVTARELLSRGLVQARELTAQPELQAQMFDVIGRLHMQLGTYDEAQPLLEEALRMRRTLYGEVHPDVVTSMSNLAHVTEEKEDFAKAIALRRSALALRRRLGGDDDDPRTLDALVALASTLHSSRNSAEAGPLIDEWLTRLSKRAPEATEWRADQLSSAALFLEYRGESGRAEPMLRQALQIRRSLFGERHHLAAESLRQLGALLDNMQRREEAELLVREAVDILRATYPDGHPQLAGVLKLHGVILDHLMRFAEAQAPLREALELRRRFSGPQPLTLRSSSWISRLH
jgi:serine/threonine-protein kinase